MQQSQKELCLDGESLTPESLYLLGHCTPSDNSTPGVTVKVTSAAWNRIKEGRRVIENILKSGEVVYGVNTGFGLFSKVTVDDDKLHQLQENLIRSHSVGVGDPLSRDISRMVMALRINVLCKGHSGVRTDTVEKYIAALNKNCIPVIPEKGTVGASGDLAPLSHLALGMMGEGQMWDPRTGTVGSAKEILAQHGLEPVVLKAKEGLALINGTQFITAIGVEALVRAERLAKSADVIAAMTLECLKGTTAAFFPLIHRARPHSGQGEVAERLRSLLNSVSNPSKIAASHVNCGRVQDAYTLRCVPQVHGITHDTLKFVSGILTTECNSATDNPMIFSAESFDDPALLPKDRVVSGGNFHGEYPAKACDYLAIGISEIGNISERRIERLCNPSLSEGLPAFLVKDGGLNSGFMIAHCTAAAVVSENKVLCHPSSVDSLSTSAAKEDHVSMGGWSARKALDVVKNVETILAIELLAACQGFNLLRPLTSTAPLEKVHSVVRSIVPPYDTDRYFKPDIDAAKKLLHEDRIWQTVEPHVRNSLKRPAAEIARDITGCHNHQHDIFSGKTNSKPSKRPKLSVSKAESEAKDEA